MIKNRDFERYSRQIILKGFGIEGQEKLANAKVLVIGAGGLGCPALQYLTAAGVGCIGIVDDDLVSLTNLHRQILYTTTDLGLPKVEAAVSRLGQLNPDITLVPYPLRLENRSALELISQYDWVIDGTDNFASRYLINDACTLLRKPLVYGAVSQYEGQIAVFNVMEQDIPATNYRDLFPDPLNDSEIPNCAEAGVLGVLPGIIGTMQAAEVLKLITGIGRPLINKLLTYNVLNNNSYEVGLTASVGGNDLIPKNEIAFLAMDYNNSCGTGEVIEVDADQFEMLRKKPSTLVIDVREPGEMPRITHFEHQKIPMSVFKDSISEITARHLILFCQQGVRSLYAGELLQKEFGALKEVYSLKGGIARWDINSL